MNLVEKNTYTLKDGSKRIICELPSNELVYFGFFIEAFEGFCNYTTIKVDNNKYLQLDISPYFINEMDEILQFLKNWELNQVSS